MSTRRQPHAAMASFNDQSASGFNGGKGIGFTDPLGRDLGPADLTGGQPSHFTEMYGGGTPGLISTDPYGNYSANQWTVDKTEEQKYGLIENEIKVTLSTQATWTYNDWFELLHTDRINFQFREFVINAALMDRSASEVAPRLLTSRMNKYEFSNEEFNKGFKIMSNFKQTPEGQEQYMKQIMALAETWSATISLHVIQASVNQFMPLTSAMRQTGALTSLYDLFRFQANNFGAAQKYFGMQAVVSNAQRVFKRRGIVPDKLIVTGEIPSILRCRKEMRNICNEGAFAEWARERFLVLDPEVTPGDFGQMTTWNYKEQDLRMLHYDGARQGDDKYDLINPLVRPRTFGEHYDLSSWNTEATNPSIAIINHETECYEVFDFIYACKASGLFNTDDDGTRTDMGRYIFGGEEALDGNSDVTFASHVKGMGYSKGLLSRSLKRMYARKDTAERVAENDEVSKSATKVFTGARAGSKAPQTSSVKPPPVYSGTSEWVVNPDSFLDTNAYFKEWLGANKVGGDDAKIVLIDNKPILLSTLVEFFRDSAFTVLRGSPTKQRILENKSKITCTPAYHTDGKKTDAQGTKTLDEWIQTYKSKADKGMKDIL